MTDRERLKAVGKARLQIINNLIQDLEIWGAEMLGILRSGYSSSTSDSHGGGFGPRIPAGVVFGSRRLKRLSLAVREIEKDKREYIELKFIGVPRDSDPKPLKNNEIGILKKVSVRTVERNLSKAYDQILANRRKFYRYPLKELDMMSLK